MEKITITCDGCNEECNYYIEIKDAILKCANGKKLSRSIGFAHLEMKNRHFCSPSCMIDYFYEKMPNPDRGDYFFPSEQIGKMSATGIELGK